MLFLQKIFRTIKEWFVQDEIKDWRISAIRRMHHTILYKNRIINDKNRIIAEQNKMISSLMKQIIDMRERGHSLELDSAIV